MKKWVSWPRMGRRWILLVPLLLSQVLAEGKTYPLETPVPELLTTEHPHEDMLVGYAVDSIPGIKLDRSGALDVSEGLQQALNWVREAGGGVLYLPAGRYRLDNPVVIPPLVGMRGDFIEPGGGPVDDQRNTVLEITHGRGGNERDTACITVDGSASIDGFVIWYPGQSGKRVVSYAPAIRHHVVDSIWGINTSSRNLYLVNAYHGIAIGSPEKGTCIQLVKNVVGTPLGTGIEIWSDADIPRLLNLDFDPVYLGQSGLPGMAAFEKVARDHLKKKASAIRYHRTDGSELAEIRVRGYRIGLELLSGTQMQNGHWIDNEGHYVNFDFRDCEYGVWIDNIKDHGTQFFNCHFEARKSAVHISNPQHGAGLAMFMGCTLAGDEFAISQEWKESRNRLFSFMMTECVFGNRIDWQAGTLTIMGSRFAFKGPHLRFGKDTVFASLVGNTFEGSPRIDDHSKGKLILSEEKWEPLEVPGYRYRVNCGSTYRPDRPVMVTVTDFGAVSADGVDDGPAIQAAIDTIRDEGGGYVLIPAGIFHIESPIVVRENVELRGVADFWQHSRTLSHIHTEGKLPGTLLMIEHGQGDPDSCTFLVEKGAGITGLAIHYPGQEYDKEAGEVVTTYPWLFRLKGDGSYLKHIMASNPWRMVDAFTYSPDNIYLGYLCGAPLDQAVHLGENQSPMLDNIHFNSWYWNHVFWPNQPTEKYADTGYKEHLDNWMKANSRVFILEGTRDVDMYGCFQFCANKAFVLKKGRTTGKGPSGIIINSGNDWSKFGLVAHANDGLKFVNMHFIDVNQFDPDTEIASIHFAPDMADTVDLFQVSTWGPSPRFVWMEGAPESRLKIVNFSYQLYTVEQVNRIYGGELILFNTTRRRDQFGVTFDVRPLGSAQFRSCFFPEPYSIDADDPEQLKWIDRWGSRGLK